MSSPSTPVASPSVSVAPRPRGWFRLLVGVALTLSVPVVAQLRLVVPIELTMLFIGPVMAACSLLAWWQGGRLWLVVAWTVLAVWMLTVRLGPTTPFDALARGWVLCLSASFGLVSLLGRNRPFFPMALAATAATFVVASILVMASSAGIEGVATTVSDESFRRLQVVSEEFSRRSGTTEWQSFAARYPAAAEVVEKGETQLPDIARGALAVFPALLGLQSLAMLALGWALFHRVSRTRIGPPLHLLSEFRFGDQLVWGVVLGVTLMVVPTLQEARGFGLNVLVFFGALYALRGLGVLAWFVAPRRPTPVLLVVAACLAGPVVGVFTLGLGLADTWLDWRSRTRPAT